VDTCLRRGLVGNQWRGPVYRELLKIVEGGLQKWSISLYGSSVRGSWRCKRRLCRWASLSKGASLVNMGEGSYAGGLCVEEGSGMGVSPYRGPIGGPAEGFRLPGTLRDEGGSRDWVSLSEETNCIIVLVIMNKLLAVHVQHS
jgi:hypothetical protein